VQLVVPAPVIEFLLHDSALTVGESVEPDPFSLIDVVLVTDPCVAVRVTVCDAVTAVATAVKFTLVAPDATVTDAGTEIALLLLERFTVNPVLDAAAVNFTVQTSLAAPMRDVLEQLMLDREGVDPPEPLPCSFTQPDVVLVLLVLSAVTLSCPVESEVDPGSNRICAVRLWPARSLAGKVPDFTVKAVLELLS
jgi:hypothetical protein